MFRKMLTSLFAVAAVGAAVAVPAGANVPSGGQGLVEIDPLECEGLGPISVFGPRALSAPVGFTTTGTQLVAQSISVTFTDEAGNLIESSKTWGNKTGYGTVYTCSQTSEGVSVTVSIAVVPPEHQQ